MIDGLELEVWGQRARRVKAVLVTEENRTAILLWLGFTQEEIDDALGGITATLDVGDAIVLTDGGSFIETVPDGEPDQPLVDVERPKPGTFTRVAASAIDHLYRRPGEVEASAWYASLDEAEARDSSEA